MTEENRRWNDRSLPPDEQARLVMAAMTEDDNRVRITGGTYEVHIGAYALDENGAAETADLAPAILP